METEGTNPVQQEEQAADVDLIRNILFGSQTRQYDERFEDLAAMLARLDGQLKDFGKALKEQARAHELQFKDIREEMRKRSQDTDVSLSELREELASAVGTLTEGTASRDSVGDMLLEMGMRLKNIGQQTISPEGPEAEGAE